MPASSKRIEPLEVQAETYAPVTSCSCCAVDPGMYGSMLVDDFCEFCAKL